VHGWCRLVSSRLHFGGCSLRAVRFVFVACGMPFSLPNAPWHLLLRMRWDSAAISLRVACCCLPSPVARISLHICSLL
jgi:hypothetical protein